MITAKITTHAQLSFFVAILKKELNKQKKEKQKEQSQKEREEREKKTAEVKEKKWKIADLLTTKPPADFDTYFSEKRKKLKEANPEKYDESKDSWITATEEVILEWVEDNKLYQIEKKAKQRMKKRIRTEDDLEKQH